MDLHWKKVAVVCDWLKDWWWAEQVLYDILEIFPEADIYSSVFIPEKFPDLIGRVRTTFLDRLPLIRTRPKMFPFLRPYAFESLDLSGYDLVISSSSAESKGIVTGPETLHVCYCHTPTRYYWSHTHEYQKNPEFGWLNPLARFVMPWMFHKLRMWDFLAAQRVDLFVANSATTAERISKYYRRNATVISPGPDDSVFTLGGHKEDFYLAFGRIIPYKRFDLIVDTFNENGLPLVIATSTQNALQRELEARSKENIRWIYPVSHEQKIELYQQAKAFLFPPEEDFWLVPIEAMLCGTPVIAFGKWGAVETVESGTSGLFFEKQNVESLEGAIELFEKMRFSPEKVRRHALKMTKQNFQTKLMQFLKKNL